MALMDYNYEFISDRALFFARNDALFLRLKGSTIEQVYGVWDCISNSWFEEAPMLVQTSIGSLSVVTHSGMYIAIGWNNISIQEKPRWYDEDVIADDAGFQWEEDLEWRVFDAVNSILGERILEILFDQDLDIAVGMRTTSQKCLWIFDAGDVTSARIEIIT